MLNWEISGITLENVSEGAQGNRAHYPQTSLICLSTPREQVREQKSVNFSNFLPEECSEFSPIFFVLYVVSQAAWHRIENGKKCKNGKKLADKSKMAHGPK